MDKKIYQRLLQASAQAGARQFLTELLKYGVWDHLFRVMGMIDYPIMPACFHFVAEETKVRHKQQYEGDQILVTFLEHLPENCTDRLPISAINVGMRLDESDKYCLWEPNSVSIDIYVKDHRLAMSKEAHWITIPPMKVFSI